ncbi:MAG TPA: hypothetical protein VGJ09_13375 [Bryobacteraceae bacterium]
MNLKKPVPSHPSEEVLEEYLFRRLPEFRVAQVEEHLLLCESCQEAVQEIEAFVLTVKAAVTQPFPVAAPVRERGIPLARMATLGSIAAVAVLAFLLVRRPEETGSPAAVRLSSNRGFDLSSSEAPAGKHLQLIIDAPGLISGQEYPIEVVDSAGKPAWKGTAKFAGGQLLAQIAKPLGQGSYWVRLNDAEGRQLREFGMSVK